MNTLNSYLHFTELQSFTVFFRFRLLTFLIPLILKNHENLWQMDCCLSSVWLSESVGEIISHCVITISKLTSGMYSKYSIRSFFQMFRSVVTYQLVLIGSYSNEDSFRENKSAEFLRL